MPDEGQGVPEDEGWVPACLAGVHLVGAVVLCEGHLHELGHVEGEGEGGDWYDVDQEASRVRHRQADRSILVGPAHGNIPKTFLVKSSPHMDTLCLVRLRNCCSDKVKGSLGLDEFLTIF